jgi:streptomycin 6-kinase
VTTPFPPAYADGIRGVLGGAAEGWLAASRGHLAAVLDRWELTVDGPVRHGLCAVVVPVRRADGTAAALKLGLVDADARPEAAALAAWAGRGAVALLDAVVLDPDPDHGVTALLLERLDPERSLHDVPDDEASAVIGELLARLAIGAPAGPAFPTLVDRAARWCAELPADWARLGGPCPRRWVDQAVQTCRVLGPDHVPVLVHGDLHHANVLSGQREPWLAIDPKGVLAEPAFDVLPVLRNRWDALEATGDLRRALERRLRIVTAAGGIDPGRARRWTHARAVDDLLWCCEHDDGTLRERTAALAEWLAD